MFKKYYKEANDDIEPDNELLERVINNSHNVRPSFAQTRNFKYAVSLAAAVVVVSTTVISMPFFENTRDDGVIIEESTVETTQPKASENPIQSEYQAIQTPDAKPAVAPTPFSDDYYNSKNLLSPTVKPKLEDKSTSQHSYNDYNNSKSGFSQNIEDSVKDVPVVSATPSAVEVVKEEIIENNESIANISIAQTQPTDTDIAMAKAYIPDDRLLCDVEQSVDDDKVYGEISVYSGSVYNKNSQYYSDSNSSEESGEAEYAPVADSGDVKNDIKTISIPAPKGFYTTDSYYGSVTFESDNGVRIVVNYSNTGGGEQAPVYSETGEEISVNFTEDGVLYNIYSNGANRETINEIITAIV